VGRRVPLVPPLGSVFVAWGTPEEVEAWLSRAPCPATAQNEERYRRMLDTVRQRGYSVALSAGATGALTEAIAEIADRPTADARRHVDEAIGELGHGEYHLDAITASGTYNVQMIAAPVFDGDGRAVLALVLSDCPQPLGIDDIISWAHRLQDTALVITRQTHGIVPDSGGRGQGSRGLSVGRRPATADGRR
jgi:DNA-binding IclR family transcriptional regulator